MSSLKKGDKGIEVAKIQVLLNSVLKPIPRLIEDGNFGQRTHDAVIRFQSMKGLYADGIVGPKTRAALGLKPIHTTSAGSVASTCSWMQIAMLEVGIHEDSLPGHNNKRIVEYHQSTSLKATDDETPWCSSFVNWVMIKAGYKGTGSAAAKSWLRWGQALTTPRQGAIAVIKRRGKHSDAATGSATGFHVGFYVSLLGNNVRILGGNQSDQVRYSNFSLTSYEVQGYRWP